jgi:hypothetical protein
LVPRGGGREHRRPPQRLAPGCTSSDPHRVRPSNTGLVTRLVDHPGIGRVAESGRTGFARGGDGRSPSRLGTTKVYRGGPTCQPGGCLSNSILCMAMLPTWVFRRLPRMVTTASTSATRIGSPSSATSGENNSRISATPDGPRSSFRHDGARRRRHDRQGSTPLARDPCHGGVSSVRLRSLIMVARFVHGGVHLVVAHTEALARPPSMASVAGFTPVGGQAVG